MNLSKYCFFIFLVLLLLFCQQASQDSRLLATIGERKIYIDEFKDRVGFNPILGNTSLSQHKEKVINSIVAEALLSQMKNTMSSGLALLLTKQKKREAIIEKLWDEIVFKDIKINEALLWSFYLKSNKQREIEFAVFRDSIHANNFYMEWGKNNPETNRILQKDTLGFTGNIAILEKAVFNSRLGKIAKPLKFGRKYLVYKPIKEWEQKILSKQGFYQKKRSVKKQYLKYTKQEHFHEYVKKTFKKQNYQLGKTEFKKLVQYLENKRMGKAELEGINPELLNFLKMDTTLNFNSSLVKFSDGDEWTIKDFMKHLAVSSYPLNYSSNDAFRYSMIRAARRILDDELLYRKGLENNLDKSYYVEWQTEMWRDYYNAQILVADNKYSSKKLQYILDSLRTNIPIKIQWEVLDALKINTTNMMVLKTHFPGQTIVPKQNDWGLKLKRKG